MFFGIFRFELRYHLSQPLFYLATFFVSLFVALSALRGGGESVAGRLLLDAPIVTIDRLTQGSFLGLFAAVAFVATGVIRDFERKSSEIVLATPVPTTSYLFGRFAGGFVASALLFTVCAVTLAASRFAPVLDPERLGPFRATPLLFGLGVMVLPTLFCACTVAFAMAAWTRSLAATYLGVVALFALNLLARLTASRLELQSIGALLDPFGSEALHLSVRYWSPSELNERLPEITGLLGMQRALWVVIGCAFLALGAAAFSRDPHRSKPRFRRRSATTSSPSPQAPTSAWVRRAGELSAHRKRAQLVARIRLETAHLLSSLPFLGLLVVGVVLTLANVHGGGTIFGTGLLATSARILASLEGTSVVVLTLVALIYAGEIVWRERSVGISPIVESTPIDTASYLAAKLFALAAGIAAFLGVGAVAGIAYQLVRGQAPVEIALYARSLPLFAIAPLLLTVLFVVLHVVAPSRFVGYALSLAFFLGWDLVGEELGLDHPLLRYASLPRVPYSDLNGYGHFVEPFAWLALYWSGIGAALVLLAARLWPRGAAPSLTSRLRSLTGRRARSRLGLAGALLTVSALAALSILFGMHRSGSLPTETRLAQRAEYEKRYGHLRGEISPRIRSVEADVAIDPDTRSVRVEGRYRIENETDHPIDELHLTVAPFVKLESFEIDGELRVRDDAHGYRLYALDRALEAGASRTIEFVVESRPRGLDLYAAERPILGNAARGNPVLGDGTFFTNRDLFPILGYSEHREIEERSARRRHGLPPDRKLAPRDDLHARRNTPRGPDAEWIEFATTVSTRADQIAIAPGRLEKRWREGDRAYFRYTAQGPIPHHFAYFSGRYALSKGRWKDVELEVYHHPGHTVNVPRMLDAAAHSLDEFSTQFSPYPHGELRIVEIPGYRLHAQAFPGTIAYSESIGFLADVQEGALDYPFYVTAHEIAHQWWSHQVVGGNVEGVAMLAETMAQYSALRVMEKRYGEEDVRRLLRYELDAYLRGRGTAEEAEDPLARVGYQRHVFYHKGIHAMYALRDAIGEEALRRAISRFIDDTAYQAAPFTTTAELLDRIREEIPSARHALVGDLFDTITLYDNRAESATYTERPDGRFTVRLVASARKLRSDGEGDEVEVPLDDWVEVAVFGPERSDDTAPLLHLEKRRVTSAKTTLEFTVAERPAHATIDPYLKLIDRNRSDNTRTVEPAGTG